MVACVSYIGSGGIYQGLGRTGMTTLDEPDMRPGPAPGSAAANAEAQEEIRQMLEAKSDRREARGEAPLDIDAEMADLQGAATPAGRGAARGGAPARGGAQRAPACAAARSRWTWSPRSIASCET